MGKRILGWFVVIILFFLVAGVASLPLEEDALAGQAEKDPATVVVQNASSAALPAASAALSVTQSGSPGAAVPEQEQIPSAQPEQGTDPQPSAPAEAAPEEEADDAPIQPDYILNISSGKFHDPSCPSVELMSEENKSPYAGDREGLLGQGYAPCQNCSP